MGRSCRPMGSALSCSLFLLVAGPAYLDILLSPEIRHNQILTHQLSPQASFLNSVMVNMALLNHFPLESKSQRYTLCFLSLLILPKLHIIKSCNFFLQNFSRNLGFSPDSALTGKMIDLYNPHNLPKPQFLHLRKGGL